MRASDKRSATSSRGRRGAVPGRILIADDDEVMLIGFAELLRRRGIAVETSNNLSGEACSGGYDVVIFDPLIEPEGLDAARRFVQCMARKNPSPSLIIVSEFLDDVGEVGAERGHEAVLHTKPIRVAALAESVEVMLGRVRARQQMTPRSEGRRT